MNTTAGNFHKNIFFVNLQKKYTVSQQGPQPITTPPILHVRNSDDTYSSLEILLIYDPVDCVCDGVLCSCLLTSSLIAVGLMAIQETIYH